MPQTPRRAVHGEEFGLVREHHRDALRTVAELEPVVQPADRVVQAAAADERAVGGRFLAGRVARQVGVGRGLAAEAQVDVPPRAGHPLDVEAGLEVADQLQLAEQCGEFVGRLLPDQDAGVADDLAGLVLAAVLAEVAQQACPQILRLADVNDPLAGVDHAVDAGPPRGVLADGGLELGLALRADPVAQGHLTGRAEQARPEPGEEVDLEQCDRSPVLGGECHRSVLTCETDPGHSTRPARLLNAGGEVDETA